MYDLFIFLDNEHENQTQTNEAKIESKDDQQTKNVLYGTTPPMSSTTTMETIRIREVFTSKLNSNKKTIKSVFSKEKETGQKLDEQKEDNQSNNKSNRIQHNVNEDNSYRSNR